MAPGGDEEGGDEAGEEGGDEEGGDEEGGDEEGGDEGGDTTDLKLLLHARAHGSCEQQHLCVPSRLKQ